MVLATWEEQGLKEPMMERCSLFMDRISTLYFLTGEDSNLPMTATACTVHAQVHFISFIDGIQQNPRSGISSSVARMLAWTGMM
jgi:hypothetical protein